MTHILKAIDLQKQYGDKVILDGINLKMRESEFCCVVGPSGCGKSTLLRLILGQEEISGGSLSIHDAPVGPPDRDRGIVYQNYALFPHLTALDNVALGLEVSEANPIGRRLRPWRHWTHKKRWRKLAAEVLERVNMGEHAKKYPHQLSGGQRQRIAIGQTLITKPSIILMDEPFSGLDPGTRDDMQLWMKELHVETKSTIFFVTHDIDEAVFLGTRVIALSRNWRRDGQDGAGARIVADVVPPPDREDRKAFLDCQDAILAVGFDKDRYACTTEFIMTHPDAETTQ